MSLHPSLFPSVSLPLSLSLCHYLCLFVWGGGGWVSPWVKEKEEKEEENLKEGEWGKGWRDSLYFTRLIHQTDRIVFVSFRKPIDQSVLLRK